ncbi:MAG: ATP-dependent zinc metalloprotease FtsH [Anaerolineae bacterium]|nr:ATP-dependent zinc metalloprotease FtsH [Anaerolineae bacterium]
MNASRFRNIGIYLLIVFAIIFVIAGVGLSGRTATEEWPISKVAEAARSERIQRIEVNDDDRLLITLLDGTRVASNKESGGTVYEQLAALGVTSEQLAAIEWTNKRASNWMGILNNLVFILPLLLVLGAIYFMMRQAQTGNNQAMSFGKSRARMFTGEQPTVTFEDVAGCVEAKQELEEIVEFLREPAKFMQLGARIPKGVLLVGPPGTGKTLIAKAVSGEAGVPFFSISGSEFVEMFVGVGASRVRDLFDQAKRHSPCIVFIDEIDAVGRHRGAGLGGSHDEREQTLNQILVEMDGFDTDTNVIIMAATNRPDILDPALLRPGRFDRRVVLDRPDVRGREEILHVHVRGKPIASDVDLSVLARVTPGFVGADLENMVNEAAILAARRNQKTISMPEFQEAIERVMSGPERRSRILSEQDRRVIAYHEAGHAIVAHLLPNCDPVLKVSIIPRGMALGYMMPLGEDILLMSRSKFRDTLAMTLGGRVSEELVFGEITTGAANDLERVTRTARDMVTRYGMSERLGPMIYGQKQEMVFLGREIGEQRDYSEAVAEEIDEEVRRIVSEAYEASRTILLENRDKLEAIAQALLKEETLDRAAFSQLMGTPVDETGGAAPSPARSNRSPERKEKGGPDTSAPLDLPPAPAPV